MRWGSDAALMGWRITTRPRTSITSSTPPFDAWISTENGPEVGFGHGGLMDSNGEDGSDSVEVAVEQPL